MTGKWVVYKYDLPSVRNTLMLPAGSEILTVQLQHDMPRLWAMVPTDVGVNDTHVMRRIEIVGTGHKMDFDDPRYIATFQVDGGTYVFHAFEVKP